MQVNVAAVERFIRVVGEKEDAIFQRRMRMLQRDKQRRERDQVMLFGLLSLSWACDRGWRRSARHCPPALHALGQHWCTAT